MVRVVVMAETRLLAELVAKAISDDDRLRVTAVVGDRRELQLPAIWRAIEAAEAVLYVSERPLETLPWREKLPSDRCVLVLADPLGLVGPEGALQLGAQAYVGRRDAAASLVERVLQAVQQGLAVWDGGLPGEQNASPPVAGAAPIPLYLTAQETELLQWLVDGQTAKEIGAQLHVRGGAARSRLRRLREKLEARSMRELVTLAVQSGFRPRKADGLPPKGPESKEAKALRREGGS